MNDKEKEMLDNQEPKETEEEEEKRSFLSGKGFYFICAVCLLAIGISAWTAFSAINPMPMDDASSNIPSTVSRPSNNTSSIVKPESNTESKPESKVESLVEKPTESLPEKNDKTDTVDTEAPPVAAFFVMPMAKPTIYKPFSDTSLQYSVTYNDYRLHKADDITSKTSDNVNACGEGIVTDIYTDALLGTTVVIDHGNGVTIKYSGLKENVNIKKGAKVTSTTVIGSLGTVPSECLDPKHLHIEVTKNKKAVSITSLVQ